MAQIRATASAVIDAAPDVVYGIIADYRNGHPNILPKPYFDGLDVESGGTGAGTVIRFTMVTLGQRQTMRAVVEEPEPGRVLVERDLGELGVVTTFTVDPFDGGRRSSVTFDTAWTRAGVKGLFERLVAPGLLRRIYREELALLAKVAVERVR